MPPLIPYDRHSEEPKEIQLLRFVRTYLGRPGDHDELGMWFEYVDEVLHDYDKK